MESPARRLSWLCIALVCSACIPISIPVGSRSGSPTDSVLKGARVAVGAAEVGLVVKYIREHLADVQASIPSHRANLHPVPCGSRQCYSAEEVAAAIEAIRRDVRAAIPDVALASRISLDEDIVEASTLTTRAVLPAPIQLIRDGPPTPGTVDAGIVDRLFDAIGDRIDRFLAHDDLNPTIHVKSAPPGAKFVMQIGDNRRTMIEVQTDDDAPSVWRGHYSGQVSKRGYREADVRVDLMTDRRTTVRCQLFPLNAPDDSNCRMEAP
jgi:hypothetical protein